MLKQFKRVRELIALPHMYCRDNPGALDRGGNMCDPLHKDALVFSILGAMRKSNAPASATSKANSDMMRFFKQTNHIEYISEWADRVIHPQVLSAVDKCIAALEKQK